jgi:penicillin-binding protein 1C
MMNKYSTKKTGIPFSIFAILLIAIIPTSNSYPQGKFTFSEIKKEFKSSESILLDRKGRILQELRTNPMERKIHWIPIENISQNVTEMVLLAEDKRFYEHEGVDYWALGSGIFRFFSWGTPRGASTITMQLATILDQTLKAKGEKTISQKWSQIQFAKELEDNLTKEEILEAYLNLVSYRGELVGIDAASKGIFRKEAHGLDENESILLASMIKNPSFSQNRLIQRACFLFQKKNETKDCAPIKELASQVLGRGTFIKPPQNLAPHIARKVLSREVEKFKTTLDIDLQKYAIQSLNERLAILQKQNVHDGAILVVENKTGDVLSYVASSNYSKSKEMDGVQARRQAGSTLKPFLYALGLEKKIITAASILDDSPVQIQVGNGVYNPSNYQGKFHGQVTARVALASSLNVPAVRLLDLVGVDPFVDQLDSMGFKDLRDADFYGLSISLGSADVTLWDLVKAYRVFANDGMYGDIGYNLEKREFSKRIYSEEVSFIISDILSDRVARSPTFGLENSLSTRYPSSVKTGTSKDMRDNWCIGFTDTYTIGVWIGNFSGESMWNVSGVSGAAPIFSDLVHYLHKDSKFSPKKKPDGIVSITVKDNLNNMSYKEYFLKGTESIQTNVTKMKSVNAIKYPLNNMIIALDPDIPQKSQVVFIEALEKNSSHFLVLDKLKLGNATQIHSWNPELGWHTLELWNEKGEKIDKIRFEIR